MSLFATNMDTAWLSGLGVCTEIRKSCIQVALRAPAQFVRCSPWFNFSTCFCKYSFAFVQLGFSRVALFPSISNISFFLLAVKSPTEWGSVN